MLQSKEVEMSNDAFKLAKDENGNWIAKNSTRKIFIGSSTLDFLTAEKRACYITKQGWIELSFKTNRAVSN